jgi:regulatory protein
MDRVERIRRAQDGVFRLSCARFGTLLVPEDLVHSLGLQRGTTLDPETVDHLVQADAAVRVHRRAMRLLAIRPRSRAELAARLLQDAPAEVVQRTLDRLQAEGLLDDERFARLWATSRRVVRGFGAARIRRELIQKGVDRETADRALREFDSADEVMLAEEAARRRLGRYARLDRTTVVRRLFAFLKRRGFSTSTILRALRGIGLLNSEEGFTTADSSVEG